MCRCGEPRQTSARKADDATAQNGLRADMEIRSGLTLFHHRFAVLRGIGEGVDPPDTPTKCTTVHYNCGQSRPAVHRTHHRSRSPTQYRQYHTFSHNPIYSGLRY
jgi:hypothetical protein